MFRATLACLFAVFFLTTPAMAKDRNVLPEAARTIDGGRAVHVLVPQAELASNVNPSNVAMAMGGGLLGVVIDAGIDSNRANNAEAGITPIRVSLTGFDGDAMAIEATNSAIAGLPWFQVQSHTFGRDTSLYAKNAALTAGAASQIAFFEWAYDAATDFSAIRVAVTMTFANKAEVNPRRPEARLQPRHLAYTQSVMSVVLLPNPTEPADNSLRWAANDGALSRKALGIAFAEVARLIPRALQWTDADVESASAGTRRTISQYSGRVVEDGPGGTLLFNRGLIHVQTLTE